MQARAVAAYRLGEYARSAELAGKAHALAAATPAATDSDILGPLSLLAAAELALGRYAEAAASFEESIAILRRNQDSDPADIAAALNNRGELHRQQGQPVQAAPFFEEAHRTVEASLGPTHLVTTRALASLALVRQQMGALEQADRDYATALEHMASAGAPPLDRARVLANHADLLLRTDRSDDARIALDQALATEEAHLAPGHPELAYTLNTLGVAADAQERYEEALGFYQRALTIRTNALPEGHPALAVVLANMAGTQAAMGRTADARGGYERALAILLAAQGEDDVVPSYRSPRST